MVVDASDAGSKSAIGPNTTLVLLTGTQQTKSGICYVDILQVSPTVSQPICQAERALGNKFHVSDSSNPISESPQQGEALGATVWSRAEYTKAALPILVDTPLFFTSF